MRQCYQMTDSENKRDSTATPYPTLQNIWNSEYQKPFVPNTINQWNSLPDAVTSAKGFCIVRLKPACCLADETFSVCTPTACIGVWRILSRSRLFKASQLLQWQIKQCQDKCCMVVHQAIHEKSSVTATNLTALTFARVAGVRIWWNAPSPLSALCLNPSPSCGRPYMDVSRDSWSWPLIYWPRTDYASYTLQNLYSSSYLNLVLVCVQCSNRRQNSDWTWQYSQWLLSTATVNRNQQQMCTWKQSEVKPWQGFDIWSRMSHKL